MDDAPSQRLLLRAARRIHDSLEAKSVPHNWSPLPQSSWNTCEAAHRRLELASRHGWQGAAVQLRTDFGYAIRALLRELEQYRDRHAEFTAEADEVRLPIQPVREIYQDLMALQQEFGALRIDFTKQELAFTTDDITFVDVDLGQFEIVLCWNEIREHGPYRVKALDSNSPPNDSAITHPHIRDDILCEGEGRSAIRRALQQGRLFDFFLLVRQIVENYNPSSAYAVIKDWNGVKCYDCGSTSSDDDVSCCRRCDHELCSDCGSCCESCQCFCCNECSSACSGCHESCCTTCSNECSECGECFCPKCLVDDQCQHCRESEPESHANDTTSRENEAEPVDANPAFQPVCLGEAAVSA